jgi:hypothetical protein
VRLLGVKRCDSKEGGGVKGRSEEGGRLWRRPAMECERECGRGGSTEGGGEGGKE